MMKKKTSIMVVVALVILAILGIVQVMASQEAATLLAEDEVAIYYQGTQVATLTGEDMEVLAISFEATFRKKVGDPEDFTYTGVPMSEILSRYGISLEDDTTLLVTAIDSYTIELTVEEIQQSDNAYLVYQQDGEQLDEESGSYMLVVKQDEFSTRWNKRVVELHVE